MSKNDETKQSDRQPLSANAEIIIDLLFWGLIDAHPTNEEGTKRLNDAKKALLGISPPKGRPTGPDYPFLMHMAATYAAERGGVKGWSADFQPVFECSAEDGNSATTALAEKAILALKAKYPIHDEKSKARNLQRRFDAKRELFVRLAANAPGLGEDVAHLNLRAFAELLAPLGIAFSQPADLGKKLKEPI